MAMIGIYIDIVAVSLTSLARRDLQAKDFSRGDWPADVEPLSLLPLCLSPCKQIGFFLCKLTHSKLAIVAMLTRVAALTNDLRNVVP